MTPLFPVAATAAVSVALLVGLHIAQGQSVLSTTVVSRIELPIRTQDGRNIDELSGLAWNEDSKHLHAISDDNVLFELALTGDAAAPSGVEVVSQTKLSQARLKSKNAEALDLVQPIDGKGTTQLLTSYEDVNKIAAMDITAPNPVEKLALSEAMTADPNDGVEALASLPNGEFAYAYEVSPKGTPDGMQSIFVHTRDGKTSRLDFPLDAEHKWRIKAIDHLGNNSFLVLLRDRIKDSQRFRNRLLHVVNCPITGNGECSAKPFGLDEKSLEGPAFEGMALSPRGQLFLVEDRKSDEGPTQLYVLQTQLRTNMQTD